MWDEMYDTGIAVSAASPSWEVFAERPSSSIMTGRGMMVQRRFLMSEGIIDKDERRMLVYTTSTVYLEMIDNGTRGSMAFFDERAVGQRWGGDELIAVFHAY
jgi:hypothetical protein